MASRIPQPGDRVRVRQGEPYFAGDRGTVISSEPPRASEHRCSIRFDDGGEAAVDSKFLTILPYDATQLRRDLAADPFVSNADYGRLVEEQTEADDASALASDSQELE